MVFSTAGNDAAYQYYLMIDARWASWPWGAQCWSNTAFDEVSLVTGERFAASALSMRSYIHDPVTPGTWAAGSQTHLVTAWGNMQGGFFPPHPSPVTTGHEITDARVSGGYILRYYTWQ